jgi:hypothetical protein
MRDIGQVESGSHRNFAAMNPRDEANGMLATESESTGMRFRTLDIQWCE